MVWTKIQEYWRPALEIIILTLGIYSAFRIIRGTRSAPVVTGFIVLLLAVMLVTLLLQLTVLITLLEKVAGILALAILILFQPELRRIFGELGNLPMLTSTHEQREAIEVVLQACENLAEVRIGALIAIERSIKLEESVESGIVVDCEATPEMIETIFFPNNAVHDGGLILKGDRITHAACIFPLTDRKDLAKSMGTRHRAAIGLSEETDAIVVVVSEETGNISYAHKGQLVRRVTIEALREFLSSELVAPTKSRTWMDWVRGLRPSSPQPPAVLLSEKSEPKSPPASS
jgi:diadenylate cyclase